MLEKLQTIHQMAPNILLSRTGLEKDLQIPMKSSTGQRILILEEIQYSCPSFNQL